MIFYHGKWSMSSGHTLWMKHREKSSWNLNITKGLNALVNFNIIKKSPRLVRCDVEI